MKAINILEIDNLRRTLPTLRKSTIIGSETLNCHTNLCQ